MSLMNAIVLTSVILHQFISVDATRCLQCTDAATPFSCGAVTECGAGEVCFVQQSVTMAGRVVYNSGCLQQQRCGARRRGLGDVITCLTCCHDDYCNVGGCGQTPPSMSQRGPMCFNCTSATPEHCKTTQTCAKDQMCAMVNTHQSGDSHWRGQCLPKPQCDVINSLGTQTGCQICCSGDFCNDRCISTSTAATAAVTTTVAPTTTTTRRTTTTAATTTTTTSTTASTGDDCRDTMNCTSSDVRALVCADVATATKFCLKSCGLCAATTTTTATTTSTTASTVDDCRDVINCSSSDVRALVCSDVATATKYCLKSCGLCGCKDALNCTTKGAQDLFCADDTAAVTYCQRTCGKCGMTNITAVRNSCNDPVADGTCPVLDDELCICQDPDIGQLCQHYCRGECGQTPTSNTRCGTETFITGKRSALLRQYILQQLL